MSREAKFDIFEVIGEPKALHTQVVSDMMAGANLVEQ